MKDPGNRPSAIDGSFRTWVEEQCGAAWGEEPQDWEPLVPDGSQRQFFRVRAGERSLVALFNPGEMTENDAYWAIGRHLRGRGVPVPALYEYDRDRGWMILEDLGDRSLQAAVSAASITDEVLSLYSPVLDALLAMQLRGREGFDQQWCCQGPRYDRELMLERESGYFLHAFLKGYVGWSGDEGPLLQEFRNLAELASGASTDFLLHRDFQSRNIFLLSPARPHIIDFQGARWGPLQYDVASLTMDPYVELPPKLREAILQAYVDRLVASGAMTSNDFLAHYPIIALHRNLQILGAFAFLSGVKQKRFFSQWIPSALTHLRWLLNAHPEWPCSRLREQVGAAAELLQSESRER